MVQSFQQFRAKLHKKSEDEIEVLRSPDDRLSKASVEAVRQWTFEPALCDGNPVGVYYNLTVAFRLK